MTAGLRTLFVVENLPNFSTYRRPRMSEDTVLTPTTLRTLSVPGTPGAGPAAPLKQQVRAARSHPPANALKQPDAEVPETTEPLNLSSAFDAVATNLDACLDTASSVVSSLGQDDTDGNQSNSLTLPLSQAPVTPDALPKASVSVRANAMRKLDDQPDAAPADEPFCETPKAATGKSVTADAAEVCPPSPPQSRPVKDSVPSKETVLGMFKGATFPHDESERLRTVALLGILDQPDDPVLTSITQLVTRLLKVSTAGELSPICFVLNIRHLLGHSSQHCRLQKLMLQWFLARIVSNMYCWHTTLAAAQESS